MSAREDPRRPPPEDMNVRLREVYEPAFEFIQQELPHTPDQSRPLFLYVFPEYHDAAVKLLVVGQETNGWGNGKDEPDYDSVEKLVGLYAGFNLGAKVGWTPFWKAAHKLHGAINPDGSERGFLWSNLVKIDVGRRRPPEEVERILSRLDLLPEEIRITRPDAVVFFTGRYDERLRATFPGVALTPVPVPSARRPETVMRLAHRDLPPRAFRTYHPRYLRMSRQWGVLDDLAALILRDETPG